MRARIVILGMAALALLGASTARTPAQEKKDYLSDSEADKIRDARGDSDRMLLYVSFADDRVAKLKYMLAHPNDDRRREEQLNALINGYSGCIDDAADLIEDAQERQQDIRAGLKSLIAKGKEHLAYLQQLDKSGPELDSYKDTLDDAIEATQDALSDADKAQKETTAPIRRKQ
jgi:hypothetical protein